MNTPVNAPELILVYPVRYIPRMRLLHLALPSSEWTLCARSRVGQKAAESELGQEVGGVELQLCTRCETRRDMLASGKSIGRSS